MKVNSDRAKKSLSEGLGLRVAANNPQDLGECQSLYGNLPFIVYWSPVQTLGNQMMAITCLFDLE